MKKLEQLLSQLEADIDKAEHVNTAVSSGSAGWHINHSLLVLNGVAEALINSKPADYKRKFSIWKTIIFTTKRIPRGRAKSPASVVPKEKATRESLLALLHTTNSNLAAVAALQANHWFRHPLFGALNVKPALNFLAIHTNHHLQIIKDIIAAG